jgi:hypothetical protein
MDDGKVALSYTQRYTINYYRKMVIALILQQCRIAKISSSVINVLCTLLEQVLTHCFSAVSLVKSECNLPAFGGFEHILHRLSQSFMSTTPKDFTIQQYIDYIINHKRVSATENIPLLFGQRNSNSSSLIILPKTNIEIIDS